MTLATLRNRLVQRLDPVEAWRPEGLAARSDFDLNPKAARPMRELRPAAVLIPVVARPEGATVRPWLHSQALACTRSSRAGPSEEASSQPAPVAGSPVAP